MRSDKGNKWMNMVEDMCAYKGNPVPEMKHGGNHHEAANYDLTSYQKKGETTGEPVLDENGNYIPFTVDPNEYSTTIPSGQRSTEMDNIDEFFQGSLNSPIYKKRLGLQGSIRDVGSGDGNEAYMFHPDYGMVTRATAEEMGGEEWYDDDNWQSMRISMPFQSWDSEEKNNKNQTKVDETVTNRLNALNTMTTDYSSEYDNKLYEKVHHVSDAVQAIAKENGIERDANGQFDMAKLSEVLPSNLREDFMWAYQPKSDQSGKWLGSHSDTAPHLNTQTGFTDADGNVEYKANNRKVSMQITPSQIQNLADEAGITYEEMEARTYAHEVGHSIGAVYEPGYLGYGNDYFGASKQQMGTGAGRFANQNYSITDNEAEIMRQMMRENYGVDVSGNDKSDKHVKQNTYARGVTEAKADMDAVRYDMYKTGIYDYREGDLDQKTLTKYLNKYRGEDGEINMEKVPLDLQRTLERYKERDFIFLNNNIAMENQQEISDDLPPVMNAKYGAELPSYKRGGEGMRANNTKAEYGMELQGEEVTDRYADDPTMETSGGDVSDGMRKGGTVYNRRKYSTGAKKYRRGGESLPKYQTKGETIKRDLVNKVHDLVNNDEPTTVDNYNSTIEFNPFTENTSLNASSTKDATLVEKRKSTSVTGEYYDGALSGHEIGDIFDFKIGNFKAGFSADHPDVLEWRSVKGFSADKLLNWYYETQVNIPYHNYKDQKEDVKTFNINDKSTWEGKNYGYQMGTRVVGSSGVIGHANENTNWYPTSHSMAHAMSRDLIGATDQQIFFYNGQPFTNEEGDEKDVRLGLKAGEQMADLEFRISNANSRSEVTEIMKEFNKNINLESLSYINNKRNPLKLKDGTLMALESILEDYRNLEDPNDNDRTETQFALHNELAKVFSGTNAESGPIIDYVKNILDGNLNNYFDDHVSELANHSELAQFRSKKELDEWTKSTEFKQGSWNPNNISYVGADGQIVTGKDIILPYNTMYHAYKPYETDENGEWPIDDFDGKPQYRIYNKEQALETNIYPISSFDNSGNSVLGGVVNWATGQDFKIPTLWGGSGADLSTLEIPVHNPYKKTFEYYDYDKDGIVIKTHTFDNPTYNSDASIAYRKMMGNNGDGKGGTITTNMHGNDFLNFMHPNSGAFSTESLELGSAIHQNPYYTNEDAFNTDSKQATQPHQFLHMSPEEVNQRFVDISGKNANSSQEWNGLNWAGAPLLGTQVLTSGLLKAASWKTAGNTMGKYWTERGKYGWLGSAGNTLGYTFKSGEKIWDATSIGRIGGASVPYTGGLININNFMIGKWTKDHLTKSYDQFGQGDIWGGTKDLAFGALSGGMLYNRVKKAYSAQNMFNYGKFPNLNNVNKIDGININSNIAGPLSTNIRQNVPAWSLREQANTLLNRNIFQPQITQGKLTTEFGNMLQRQKMNPNVTPSLLPPNYRLGDLNK
jgi:hypothetical protein